MPACWQPCCIRAADAWSGQLTRDPAAERLDAVAHQIWSAGCLCSCLPYLALIDAHDLAHCYTIVQLQLSTQILLQHLQDILHCELLQEHLLAPSPQELHQRIQAAAAQCHSNAP